MPSEEGDRVLKIFRCVKEVEEILSEATRAVKANGFELRLSLIPHFSKNPKLERLYGDYFDEKQTDSIMTSLCTVIVIEMSFLFLRAIFGSVDLALNSLIVVSFDVAVFALNAFSRQKLKIQISSLVANMFVCGFVVQVVYIQILYMNDRFTFQDTMEILGEAILTIPLMFRLKTAQNLWFMVLFFVTAATLPLLKIFWVLDPAASHIWAQFCYLAIIYGLICIQVSPPPPPMRAHSICPF
jgi:uncharacterized membrane protein YciS (DUF1049 family)